MSNSRLSPQEAARELLRRREARESLLAFTEYTKPDFQAGAHHAEIASALEAVERRECDRLIIEAPPRHTKSELASRRFPAWYLGRHPSSQLIAATYSGDFALDFGRDVRAIVQDERYSNLFPDVQLAQDSKAANRWHTTDGGVSVYVGVGGPITGRGAHVALIDDPFKNREEADSEVRRETVWKWYTSTLRTRLMPGGAIILILTRWHEDDLAGRLLDKQGRIEDGGQWRVVELQAIANENTDEEEALWPEWYPLEELKRIRNEIGPRDWSALYQQKPQPEEGTFFKRENFEFYDELPKHLHIYGASDYAVTDGSGDYTEHGVFGIDALGDPYVIDWWRGQTAADEWIEAKLDLVDRHQPLIWGGEAGAIRKSVEPFLMRRMRERHSYCRIEWLASIHDKPTRARAIQAIASSRKIRLPNEPWAHEIMRQCLQFPAGKFDDAVDVFSIFGRMYQEIIPAIIPQEKEEPRGYDYGFGRSEEDSWRVA